MSVLLIFIAAGVGTFLIRLSGVILLRDRDLPPRIAKALSLVGPAAMAAIVANALLLDHGDWRAFGAWHLAALVAVGVALWRRTSGGSMAAGAVAFAALLLAGV